MRSGYRRTVSCKRDCISADAAGRTTSERDAAIPREFHLSGRKLEKPRAGTAKVEWPPGELYPRVGFIVTNMSRPAARVCFLQQARNMRAMDQGRQGRDQMDAAVMSDVRGQRR